MIRLTLSQLIFIYLLLFLAGVFSTWLWTDLRRKHREKRAARHQLRCTICACDFEDASADALARCPRCGSLNERFRPGTL